MTKIEGIYSAKAGSLANQSLLAEGVAGSLDTAASQQYVSGTGGASGLLNNMMA